MASFHKINSFVEAMPEGKHDFSSDTLKIALSNTAVSAGMTVLANVTQISSGNGYSTGGKQATVGASAQSAGTYQLTLSDVVFTASGGSVGPFRYAVLYNDDAPSDELIGWYDYGTSITLADTETLTIDFLSTGSGGTLTLA